MADRILVRLDEAEPGASWLALDARGTPAGAAERGPIEALAGAARGRRVTLLAPGAEVLLTEAELPTRNRQRLLKALPYALEEHLADDVDALHLAVGAGRAGGRVAVAAVARARLDGWLAALQGAALEPAQVVPETLALPLAEGEWRVLVEGDQALVRSGPQTGFAADRENLPALLRAALEEAGEARPARVVIGGDGAEAVIEARAAVADLAEVLDDPAPLPALELFARGLAAGPAIDLIQGPYDRQGSLGAWLRPWALAAALALLWLALEAGLRVADYRQLQAEQAELAAQVEAIFREALPGTQRMVNPRVQMERALASVRPASAGGEGFLSLLAGAGEALHQVPGARVLGLGFRAGRIDLDLEVPDLQALDGLKRQLETQRGLQASIQSVTAREGRVQGRVQVGGGRA
jgi:general secretion pathway protein L